MQGPLEVIAELLRISGRSWLQVNDGSTLTGLQVVVNPECEGYGLIDDGRVATGASVAVIGELTESPGGRQKVRPLAPPSHTLHFI